jgi:hypothetical protein
MAKAILEFDLTDSDDRMEHFRAVKSADLALALFDILNRTIRKTFETEIDSEGYEKEFIDVQEILQVLDNRGINLDEVIQ